MVDLVSDPGVSCEFLSFSRISHRGEKRRMQMASAFQATFSFSAPLPAEVIGYRIGLGSRIEPDGGATTLACRAMWH